MRESEIIKQAARRVAEDRRKTTRSDRADEAKLLLDFVDAITALQKQADDAAYEARVYD